MGAAFRRSIPLTDPPTTRSGVHARVRDDDEDTVVTDVHERDTLPPPANAAPIAPHVSELADVHARDTVNQKLSPEFLAYLRSFDVGGPRPVAADPATPQPWTQEPRDEQPEIEVAESFDDEETLLVLPSEAPAPAFIDEPTTLDARSPEPLATEDDDVVPSFRDGRAIACVVAVLSAVAGAVATVVVMS